MIIPDGIGSIIKASQPLSVKMVIAEPIKIGRSYQLWESKIYHNEKLCAISKVRLSKIK